MTATAPAAPVALKYRCLGGIVAPGKVGAPKKLFRPGELLPDDFPADKIKDFIASGHVEEVTAHGLVLASKMPVAMIGKWIFNPTELKKMSLQALNAMVAERDPSVAMFKDKEAAIAQLSREFRP